MNNFQVSIIIPVHNTAPYLKRCIDSVCNQTLKEIEIILVENLSTDNSAALCDEYAKKDSRIKVLHLSIADLSTARNEGIKIASAPYISFIDSDDYILPDMYQDLWQAITAHNSEIAYCNNYLEFEEDRRVEAPYPDTGKVYLRSPVEVVRDIFDEKTNNSAWAKLYRRDVFDWFMFPENRYLEDYATVYRWVANCKSIVWVDKSYYYYIQRGESIMRNLDFKKWYDFFKAEYLRLEFIKERKIFPKEDEKILVNQIVEKCMFKFDQCVRKSAFFKDYNQVREMREDLYRIHFLFPDINIPERFRKRIWKIHSHWCLYYFIRYCL